MKRRSLALLLDHSVGEYQESLRMAVEAAGRERQMHVLTVVGRALDAKRPADAAQNSIYDLLGQESVDAVIVSGVVGTWCTAERFARLRDQLRPLPLCSVGIAIPGVPTLTINNQSAMRLMIDHAIWHGCRRIVFIRGPVSSIEAEQRYWAYVDGLKRAGLDPIPELVGLGDFSVTSGAVAMRALLEKGVEMDAVLAANDNMALGALGVLRERGVHVPEDLIVGGFDDFPLARFSNPPLTTVGQPLYKLGQRAVDVVCRQLAGEAVPELEEIPSDLVLRQSCGCTYGARRDRTTLAPRTSTQTPLELLESRLPALRRVILESTHLAAPTLDGWLDRLTAALTTEVRDGSGRFLRELEDLLEVAVVSHEPVEQFHTAISILRSELQSAEGAPKETRALEDLWQAAGVAIGMAAARAGGRERLAAEFAAGMIRESIERLSSTLSHETLHRGLVDLLPAVKIPLSLVALYADRERLSLRTFVETRENREINTTEPQFPAKRLLPMDFLPEHRAVSMIVQALTFEADQFGVVALESGTSGVIYEMLREQISASLKGAALHQSVVREMALRERAERRELEGELRIAERIQTAILPGDVSVDWLEIAAKMLPAQEVGGDYYDILPCDEACWVGIGDVTGHGLRAGLVMLMIQSMVSALVQNHPDSAPGDIVNHLNATLYRNIRLRLGLDDHATFSLLRIDPKGRLTWAGAHEDLVVLRASTGKCETHEPRGTWIGARPDITSATETCATQLDPGDRVILYTDGLIEARNTRDEQFGFDRVCTLLESSHSASNQELCTTLVEAAQSWTPIQEDDITVVVLRYVP